MKEHYDVIIVGTGAAGLYCALNLPEKMKILLITKQEADQSDSFLAQGGICMLRGEDDYENYFEDTMRAGHYENNKRAMILSGIFCVIMWILQGMVWEIWRLPEREHIPSQEFFFMRILQEKKSHRLS